MPTGREQSGVVIGDAYVAAQLYYEEGLDQQHVAERMGISRPSVSRLLSYARGEGIVEIVVHPPATEGLLARELASALRLHRAVVVDVKGRGASQEALASAASIELASLGLGEASVFGTAWGEMVRRVASASPPVPLDGASVIPLVGTMDEPDPRFQSNEIARAFAARGRGNVVFIAAPIAPTRQLARAIREDPHYRERLSLWDRLDAAVVGIGTRPADARDLPMHLEWSRGATDAVGDVAGRLYTITGDEVDVPPEHTLLGVTRDQLKAAATVVGVAAGNHKVRSIVGASRAALVKTLVTDAVTARAILAYLDLA